MGSKSKNKGKSYEREIAKLLSSLYDEAFERVPNSGAFTGGKNAYRRKQLDSEQEKLFVGDIIPPSNWNIVIECKNYKKMNDEIINIAKGKSSLLNKWINEVRFDANGEFHILFFKIPYHGTFVVLNDDLIKAFPFPKLIYEYDLGRGVKIDYVIFHEKYLQIFEIKKRIEERARNA